MTLVSQTQSSGQTCKLGNSGNSLSDTIATLPAGSTAVIRVVAAVSASTANDTALTNSCSVSGTNAPSASWTTTTEVQNQAALAVMLGAPTAAAAGGNLTYTLTVTNNGSQEAQNVVLSDLLPAGLSFVSQSQSGGPSFQLSNSGNQVSDSIAALAAGASAQFTITEDRWA
jgi:uncharacterized repeat protein (TIGR01451 family)